MEESKERILDMSEIGYNAEGSPISSYLKWLNDGTLITGVDFQRNFVWSDWKQSNLILSALIGIPIPAIQIYRPIRGRQEKKVSDGRQRLTTFQKFYNNELVLNLSKFPFTLFTIDGEVYDKNDLNGLVYKDLSPELQKIFLDRNIKIEIYSGADDDLAEVFFSLMNMGSEPLKPQEIRLATMGKKNRTLFNEIKKYSIFEHAQLSPAQRNNNIELDMIAQTVMLLNFNEPCELSGDNVSGFINQYRQNGLPEEISIKVDGTFKYLSNVMNILVSEKEASNATRTRGRKAKTGSITKIQYLNKNNIVMLAIEADKAIDNNISIDNFAELTKGFFKDVPLLYKNANSKNSASLESVRTRMKVISEYFTSNTNKTETDDSSNNSNINSEETKSDNEKEPEAETIDNFEQISISKSSTPKSSESYPSYDETKNWEYSESMIPHEVTGAIRGMY